MWKSIPLLSLVRQPVYRGSPAKDCWRRGLFQCLWHSAAAKYELAKSQNASVVTEDDKNYHHQMHCIQAAGKVWMLQWVQQQKCCTWCPVSCGVLSISSSAAIVTEPQQSLPTCILTCHDKTGWQEQSGWGGGGDPLSNPDFKQNDVGEIHVIINTREETPLLKKQTSKQTQNNIFYSKAHNLLPCNVETTPFPYKNKLCKQLLIRNKKISKRTTKTKLHR